MREGGKKMCVDQDMTHDTEETLGSFIAIKLFFNNKIQDTMKRRVETKSQSGKKKKAAIQGSKDSILVVDHEIDSCLFFFFLFCKSKMARILLCFLLSSLFSLLPLLSCVFLKIPVTCLHSKVWDIICLHHLSSSGSFVRRQTKCLRTNMKFNFIFILQLLSHGCCSLVEEKMSSKLPSTCLLTEGKRYFVSEKRKFLFPWILSKLFLSENTMKGENLRDWKW